MATPETVVPEESKRKEIHSLEFSVSILVHELNKLLFGKVEGWLVSPSLNIKVAEDNRDPGEVIVFIRPVNWPEPSYISCRFLRFPYEGFLYWQPYKGGVWAPHLNLRFPTAIFKDDGTIATGKVELKSRGIHNGYDPGSLDSILHNATT